VATLRRFLAGIKALVSPDRGERELDAELRAYLELAMDKHVRSGSTHQEAVRLARMELGGVEAVKDRVRDVGWESAAAGIWRDLRHAVRSLRKAPAFTTAAVATLALGFGATTAIFSIVYGVMLKPLPFPEPGRLVSLVASAAFTEGRDLPISASLYFTIRDGSTTLEDVGLWTSGSYSLTGVGEPEQVRFLAVTDGTLPLLRIRPFIGRRFTSEDNPPRAAVAVAMLSYGYWQSRFGGDPAVLGRTIAVNGRPREIVGVLPASFRFLNEEPAVLLPLAFDRNQVTLGQFNYHGLARLKPGVTIEHARADLARLLALYPSQWPPPPGADSTFLSGMTFSPIVRPLKAEAVSTSARMLWVLLATTGLVLLIAGANVANLLLVRIEGRYRELAVRGALGAGHRRIAQGLCFESLLLALLGGAAGLAVTAIALRILSAVAPATLPRRAEIGIDATVVAFMAVVAIVSGLIFGAIMAVRHARAGFDASLGSGGRSMSHGRERQRARDTLVVVQVALALVLLIGSGLMIRTFQAMRRIDPGFSRPAEVRTLRLAIPQTQVARLDAVVQMQQQILDRLRDVGGVTSVAFGSTMPMDGNYSGDPIFVEGREAAPGAPLTTRQYKFSSPGYFATIGTRLIAGREFTWTDVNEKRRVAIVSENVAREIWGDPRSALGGRIQDSLHGPWREVVGVVGDIHDDGVARRPSPSVYWPLLVENFWGQPLYANRSAVYAIRTPRTDDEALMKAIQEAVWSVNAKLPLADVRTLERIYDQSMAQTTFALVMLAIAGGMALALGVIGVYGVIAYAVTQRWREIGIRAAIGAPPAAIQRMFLRQGFVLGVTGVGGGLVIAAALTRAMKSLLFGIDAVDPVTYAAIAAGLTGAVIAATYLPARYATRVDPLIVLRD
jgi:predicted permease